ncbi:MAG: hypothetical protein KIT84_08070 [Labilithrix sp.]|nr:hypothetical protein [Labilithrix sp.]
MALTLGLVVARPRIGARFRLTPATAVTAGVAVLTALGSVRVADIGWAASTMWRPLLGVVSIMVMTGVARRMGVLDGIAEIIFRRAARSAGGLFAAVFAFGTVTAAVLNNDSAILLLTPLVVDIARRRRPDLVIPLAFAVFLSAGVAPLVVSNPMNMVVASYAGIGFNDYARAMALPSIAGGLTTFAVAWLVFRRSLGARGPRSGRECGREATRAQSARAVSGAGVSGAEPLTLTGLRLVTLLALGAVVVAYPVVSYFGGPVWIVAAAGAVLLLAIGAVARCPTREVLRDGVHADTLLFLVGALILSIGLRNVGILSHLASVYDGASPMKVGLVSAVGSAILNNHPMSHLNMFALGAHGAGGDAHAPSVLAALIGGDLGPRMFPMGSLAGLLWFEMLRRGGVELPMRRFLWIGATATLPALFVSLYFLA